jgi:hypothetical protein
MNKFCLNDKNKILLMTALGSGVAALAAAGPTIASASFTAFSITGILGVFARFGVNPALGVNPLLVYVVPVYDGRSFLAWQVCMCRWRWWWWWWWRWRFR